jgi:hypothetical protein
MPSTSKRAIAPALALVFAAAASSAFAWGAMGHREIGVNAMRALPQDTPGLLRTNEAAVALGELAREPDRWRDAGKIHDTDRDPAHFLNIDDLGHVYHGPAVDALPPTREDYDTVLHAMGPMDQTKVGWLPYAIVDTWQQVAKDFAYWRIDGAAAERARTAQERAWFEKDQNEREALILRDIGEMAHYVGDGSQPMHVSVHYNGWGPFPNPNGYTQDHIHSPLEGIYIHNNVTAEDVAAKMSPYRHCDGPIEPCVIAYLETTRGQIEPLYALQKAGGFEQGDPRGRAFMAGRLAAGASELRDLIVDAWIASETTTVGYPAISVADVKAGSVEAYPSLYGKD